MKVALAVVGWFLLGSGWLIWDSRYMIANLYSWRERKRVGASAMAVGALLMALGVGL